MNVQICICMLTYKTTYNFLNFVWLIYGCSKILIFVKIYGERTIAKKNQKCS